ncbi:MAG: hypothetical protein VXW43_19675, partial [Pseudomonadota bacterium]|nr:hypothetical protein [Pseudomonadota bacterium]
MVVIDGARRITPALNGASGRGRAAASADDDDRTDTDAVGAADDARRAAADTAAANPTVHLDELLRRWLLLPPRPSVADAMRAACAELLRASGLAWEEQVLVRAAGYARSPFVLPAQVEDAVNIAALRLRLLLFLASSSESGAPPSGDVQSGLGSQAAAGGE